MKYTQDVVKGTTIININVEFEGRDALVASLSTVMGVLRTVSNLTHGHGIVFNDQAKEAVCTALGTYALSLLKQLNAKEVSE